MKDKFKEYPEHYPIRILQNISGIYSKAYIENLELALKKLKIVNIKAYNDFVDKNC